MAAFVYPIAMADAIRPIERSVEACLLLDHYGSLLTERVRRLLDLHFGEDLSYGEIAEQTGTSRQAVHDGVSRGLEQLKEFEARLGLAARTEAQRERLERALRRLGEGRDEDAAAELRALLDEL